MNRKMAIKSTFIFTKEMNKFEIFENSYLIIDEDKIEKIVNNIDEKNYNIIDYSNRFIIPGFVDTHIHAPQINNIGLGMDVELLEWLTKYTFPEESKYKDLKFAKIAYIKFINMLLNNGITSSVVFGSIYKDSTLLLMDLYDKIGLRGLIGKVNMDRNSPNYYIEDTKKSLQDTIEFIEASINKYKNVKPIITPRFVPSCTKELMIGLGKIAKKYNVKTQSHLSENLKEIELVKSLHPECNSYIDVYKKYGILRKKFNTVMAHCVWSNQNEIDILKEYEVIVSHCPYSNGNISSGIAPIVKFKNENVIVGLGSDISGGHEINMGKIVTLASIFSKLRFRHIDENHSALRDEEIFYMATKGGGKIFGNVGSFEKGYMADFLVINDELLTDMNNRNIVERLQRFLNIGDDRNIEHVYVSGKMLK